MTDIQNTNSVCKPASERHLDQLFGHLFCIEDMPQAWRLISLLCEMEAITAAQAVLLMDQYEIQYTGRNYD